jgi:hypothetical protein
MLLLPVAVLAVAALVEVLHLVVSQSPLALAGKHQAKM